MNGITAVFFRDYRQRMTNIGFVFWDLFVLLAYLVLFGIGFERMIGSGIALEGRAFSYTTFLVPGVLGMVTFSVAMNTSWGFFMDKDSGIFYELLTYLNPMTWQVDLLRFSVLGVGSPFPLLLEGVALLIFVLVCLVLAIRALNRAG